MLAALGLFVGAILGYYFMGPDGALICGAIGFFMGIALDAQSDK